jgi:hypothetical protein
LRAMVILDFGCMKPNKKFFPSQNKWFLFTHTWEKKTASLAPQSFLTTLCAHAWNRTKNFPKSDINDFYSHRLRGKNGITRATVILDDSLRVWNRTKNFCFPSQNKWFLFTLRGKKQHHLPRSFLTLCVR